MIPAIFAAMNPGKYILCIDDDEDDCSLLGDALHKNDPDYRLQFVKSGELAIILLREALEKKDLPDLIVLDINMPIMDGRATLLEIKRLLGNNYVPLLFLTTTPRDEDLVLGESQGVTIMTKPRSLQGYDDVAKTIFDSMLQ